MKPQFYSMRVLFFSLLLSIGMGNAVNGQTINLADENFSTGGNGTSAEGGHVLLYTITGNTGSGDATLTDNIPTGTSYVAGSTTLNGAPVADVNNTMPYATGGPLAANTNYVVAFKVMVTSNVGTITNVASIQAVGSSTSIPSPTTITVLMVPGNDCGPIYQLATSSPTGKGPGNRILPYNYIQTVGLVNASLFETIYSPGGLGKEIPKNGVPNDPGVPVSNGTVLTDATALGQVPSRARLYFINKPVNNVPANLCYIQLGIPDPTTNELIAYRYASTPLTTNTAAGYYITRMTFDAAGNGYALTENNLEFIHFTIDINTNIPAIDAPVTLINDPGNGTHDFLAETGGDISSDGGGKLIFVANSGNVYRIDPATLIAKFEGQITLNGAAVTGCTGIAIDAAGFLYLGGLNQNLYKVTLSTLTATLFGNGYWATTDFATCVIPLRPARVATNGNTVLNNSPLSADVAVQVQPNPFHKELNVQVQLNTAEVVRVRLIDFYGRTVYATSEKLGAGANSLRLPVPAGLGTGMYVLELWAGNNRLVQKKLLKQ